MIYALSDLHLALNMNKPMNKFGKNWENHPQKIIQNWNNIIDNNDLVLVSGDISWAMNMSDAKADLDFIEKLNGSKVLGYGNHDYWWNSTNKLNNSYNTITFVKNNYYLYKDFIIYVIKGSDCPYTKNNKKNNKINNDPKNIERERLYSREISRLEHLLTSTENLVQEKNLKSILMLHYPPTNDLLQDSKYTQLINKYKLEIVIFGHLHANYNKSLQGRIKETNYFLTSADYLKFSPILIVE